MNLDSQLQGIAVGGHGGEAIIIGPEPGQIQKKVNHDAELDFYTSLLPNQNLSEESMKLFPKFYGEIKRDDDVYIVMEDLTYGYDKPCMLDVKMGVCTVSPDANEEKRIKMGHNDETTTTKKLGQRLTGYRVWNVKDQDYEKIGKTVTKKISNEEDYLKSLKKFFHNGEKLRTDVVQHFLGLLDNVHKYMSQQSEFTFYSSSLLFVYDGSNNEPHGRLKMIDFAHVFEIEEEDGRDEGYIFGLEKMIEYFKKIADSEQ